MAYKEGEWFEKHGFNENRTTYIYFPANSYEVKDELKDAGFRFEKPLLWHAPEVPEGYEDKVVEVWFDAIGIMSAWHEGFFGEFAEQTIKDRIKAARPTIESKSEWVGNVKDKITRSLIVIFNRGIKTRYGTSQLVKFEDAYGNVYTWWASAAWAPELEIGDTLTIAATIKDHSEYEGEKTTVLTRCRRM